MRRSIIVGNWKMNMTRGESAVLAREIVEALGAWDACDVGMCPVFTSLDVVVEAAKDSSVWVGAQNAYWETSGAYTGEISTEMLRDAGCKLVILGHSERRHIMNETSAMVAKKLRAVLDAKLSPIVCVGETKVEKDAGRTEEVISSQLHESLAGISEADMAKVIIAYEPVWAIGTGDTATPTQAADVHKFIRQIATDIFSSETAQALRIQYGGSVKPDNAAELLSKEDIDGALIGGASLNADSFAAIVRAHAG